MHHQNKYYSVVCLLVHATVTISERFEFCGNNQLFTFSKEACPGGILFKKPVELSEPCHCINKHLTVYSTCGNEEQMKNQSNSNYPTKVCRRFDGYMRKRDSVLIRLVQPTETTTDTLEEKHKSVQFRHKDSKCRKAHEKCAKVASNMLTHPMLKSQVDKMGKNEKNMHTRKRHHEHSYPKLEKRELSMNINHEHHQQKRQLSISNILDDKLRERIQDTMDLLNEMQFGSEITLKPKSMSFQLLEKTVKIYNYITPSAVVNDEVINSILTLFLKKYSDMELPGYSGRLTVDDQVDRAIFENVMGSLQECASRASDSSQEFEFVTTKYACPPNITHVIHKVNMLGSGFKRIRYELGGFMPADRKYVPEDEDFVLGALWKVFDTVYSYCFSSVFSYRTSQTLNNYFVIINNIFTSPWIAGDLIASNGQGTFMYTSRVEHENLKSLMINIDFMSEAVHLLSKFKTFFKKPVSRDITGNRPKREDGTTTPKAPTSESPIFQNRRQKRSIPEEPHQKWDNLEIWEGRAFCLQTIHPDLPPSIANAFPNVEDLCA